jgi:hypothetical protein
MAAESETNCFRCAGQALICLQGAGGVTFYECPACNRQYAQRTNGPLTYRWGHPISLVLYGFTSSTFASNGGQSESIDECAVRVAQSLSSGRTPGQVNSLFQEIEIELAEPTHEVRNILSTSASEGECRAFLRMVTCALKGPKTEARNAGA